MVASPFEHWEVVEVHTSEADDVLAYRLACCQVFFDKYHRALLKTQLAGKVRAEYVDKTYPKTNEDLWRELDKLYGFVQ